MSDNRASGAHSTTMNFEDPAQREERSEGGVQEIRRYLTPSYLRVAGSK
jgi:hypothetical protein